jgi:hypothetical protein
MSEAPGKRGLRLGDGVGLGVGEGVMSEAPGKRGLRLHAQFCPHSGKVSHERGPR